MVSWLQFRNYFEYSQVVLLDNCAINKINQVVALFKKLKLVILYISVYSSDFAALEMCFYLIKKKTL